METVFPFATEQAVDRAIEILDTTPCLPGYFFATAAQMQEMLEIPAALLYDAIRQLLNLGRLAPSKNGYVVAPEKIVRNTWSMSSLSEAMANRNLSLSSKVLFFNIVEAPKVASAALHLSLGEKVFYLHRLRYLENRPFVVELSYLPVSQFAGLLSYDFAQNSLYKILDEKYQVRAENQSLEFFIETPTPEEAEWLELKENDPLLTLSGTTYNQRGHVFEYSISKSPGLFTCYESSPVLKGLF